MPRLSSQQKRSEETFNVTLSGGSPWGFMLDGGSDFRKKLIVSKIMKGGKADLSQSIAVGDEVLAINAIPCESRADAMELVRYSRQKLKITLRREGNSGLRKQSNGPVITKSTNQVPNFYKTAVEHFSNHNSDFFSTYNVDREKFAEITRNKNIYVSTDNLSSSIDDLLESCRQGSDKHPNNGNSAIREDTNEWLSSSSTEIANGRTSPIPEMDGLSGVSLPESSWPVYHERTNTSPGRIQKVTVKSTNIAVSPSKGSPPGREMEKQQTAENNLSKDDWVGRWLLEEPQRVTPINAGVLQYKDRNKHKGRDKDIADRSRGSMREKSDAHKSQTLPSNRSFGGADSYGVTVTATAVKRNEGGSSSSSNTLPSSRGANRYSSSNLIQEKASRPALTDEARPDELSSWQPQRQWNSNVYAVPGDKVEVRLPWDPTVPKMTKSESTSNMDSVDGVDSSVGGVRRQCPAPPPRRSTSKLLTSFRSQGRRQIPQEIPPKFGAVSRLSEGTSSQPIHSPSRSWPTENIVEPKLVGSEITRQSWHAEPTVLTGLERREANSSISSTSSDVTPERRSSKSSGARVKTSVVIKSMRSPSSSSIDDSFSPTVYRSGQVSPEGEVNRARTLPVTKKLSDGNASSTLPPDGRQWMSRGKPDSEAVPNKIMDTQILQRLLKDNDIKTESTPSVKSRIANFEGEMRRKTSDETPPPNGLALQRRSHSHGKIDVQRPMKSYSSMDSLLDNRPPRKLIEVSTDKNKSLPQTTETSSYLPETHGSIEKRDWPSETPSIARFHKETEERSLLSEVRLTKGFDESSTERTTSWKEKSPTSNISESYLRRKEVEPELPPPSSNYNSDVFMDGDESLPPPPPLEVLDPLETSQDSLPLPSPPREVLVEFPISPREPDSISTPVSMEPSVVRDAVKHDEIPVAESALVQNSSEFRFEENGPGKIGRSIEHEQPLENTSSTESSFLDTSPTERKRESNRAPPPSPLMITTSTPTKDDPAEMDTPLDNSVSPYSLCSSASTPSGSRPNSVWSPKLEALDKEKSILVESMKQKIADLRSQMDEIKEEIDGNEEIGLKVSKIVEKKASPTELSKYQLFTGELNKIIGLLLSLTQRMHRYEMMLNDLDMSEEADRQQKDILLSKIDKVTLQHEEACKIKEVNDKRGEAVSKILENCLEENEFADFQYYIDMKTQLALMHAEIRDKVKMGEERLNTLTSTKIDWSIFSLT